MSDFKVLYRKYRPTNFDEIVGQESSIKILKNAIVNNKISHAYIFTGPRGTGKTSTAKIFAKTINCENSHNGLACEECSSCQNYGNSADIIEIDAASNNGVDEIRELINNVKIAPTSSKYKVYIIDEVHMLSQSAFNALLLTLEEPPSHAVFILATTNIENVPITVLSRCQRFDFHKITEDKIFKQLQSVCKKEKITYEEDALKEISYLSDGGLRDALGILNQLSTHDNHLTLELVMKDYGSVSNIKIKKMVDNFIENDFESLRNIFNELNNMTFDYKLFIKKMVDILFEKSFDIKVKNDNMLYTKIKNTIFELNDLINKINININPFQLIFMILVDKMEVNNANVSRETKVLKENHEPEGLNKNYVPRETLNSKVSNIENKEDNYVYIKELMPIRINNCFVTANKQKLMNAKNEWQNFKNVCSLPEIKNMIVDSQVVMASDTIYIIALEQEIMAEVFNYHYLEVEEEYQKQTNQNVRFVALSETKWNEEKEKYVANLKKGEKYTLKDEPKQTKSDIIQSDDIKTSSQEQDFDITAIFDKNKVEVK